MQEFRLWVHQLFLMPSGEHWQPPVDVCEDADAFHIVVEVAGMNEQDIEVVYQPEGFLVVRGTRRPPLSGSMRCFVLEIAYGNFERRIPLPSDIDPDGITASYKSGMLYIRIPKMKTAHILSVRL